MPDVDALPPIDSDSPWKSLIESFFRDFIAFFLPVAHDEIDWARGYDFLDKELQQVSRDAVVGKRYADKLIKVWTFEGEEAWVLIHVEVQSSRDPDFAERMLVYRYRIHDRFRRDCVSLAVLVDSSPQWRPDRFEIKRWGDRLLHEFPSVKLLDYQERIPDLLEANNPIALAVVAQLRALDSRRDGDLRYRWKRELVWLLYRRGYSREQVIGLFEFIDWLIALPAPLELEFQQELQALEAELGMPYITSVERIGIEKGRKEGRLEGRQEGRQEGETTILLSQLCRRFGNLSPALRNRISGLNTNQLEDLAIALLDFTTLADLEDWLAQA